MGQPLFILNFLKGNSFLVDLFINQNLVFFNDVIFFTIA